MKLVSLAPIGESDFGKLNSPVKVAIVGSSVGLSQQPRQAFLNLLLLVRIHCGHILAGAP